MLKQRQNLSQKNHCSRAGLSFSILWGRWVGDHPQEDLTNQDWLQVQEDIGKIYNSYYVFGNILNLLSKYGDFSFFLSKYGLLWAIFAPK
jgi:hypothetical protein